MDGPGKGDGGLAEVDKPPRSRQLLGRNTMLNTADEIVLNNRAAEVRNLPADRTALVQRVFRTRGTQRFHNNLDVRLALAAQLHHTKGVFAIDDGRMDFSSRRASTATGGNTAYLRKKFSGEPVYLRWLPTSIPLQGTAHRPGGPTFFTRR